MTTIRSSSNDFLLQQKEIERNKLHKSPLPTAVLDEQKYTETSTSHCGPLLHTSLKSQPSLIASRSSSNLSPSHLWLKKYSPSSLNYRFSLDVISPYSNCDLSAVQSTVLSGDLRTILHLSSLSHSPPPSAISWTSAW